MYGLDPAYVGSTLPLDAFKDLTKKDVAGIQVAGRKDVAELRAAVSRERNAIAKIVADARVTVLEAVTNDDLISNTAKLEKMYENATKHLLKVQGETSDRTFGKGSPGWDEYQAQLQAAQTDVNTLRGIINTNRTRLQDAMGGGVMAPDVEGLTPRQKALGGARDRLNPPLDLPPI